MDWNYPKAQSENGRASHSPQAVQKLFIAAQPMQQVTKRNPGGRTQYWRAPLHVSNIVRSWQYLENHGLLTTASPNSTDMRPSLDNDKLRLRAPAKTLGCCLWYSIGYGLTLKLPSHRCKCSCICNIVQKPQKKMRCHMPLPLTIPLYPVLERVGGWINKLRPGQYSGIFHPQVRGTTKWIPISSSKNSLFLGLQGPCRDGTTYCNML